MSTRMQSSIALLGIVLAGAWTAACGGGTATEMVSSPDVAVGAAIQGKVSVASGSGGQAFGFEAGLASSAVRVSVVGTDRSTTTDPQGRFTLTGLSAGQVTLRFQATGVDARLSLGGLVDGQVLTIDVQVSGSDASLMSGDRGEDDDDDDQAGEVEFEGVIESLTPPSLVVAGRSVLTDSSTEFKGKGSIDSIADLSVGDLVEVEGVESTTGSVLAREIKRVEEAGDDDEEDEDDDEDDDDDDEEDENDDDDDDNSGSGS